MCIATRAQQVSHFVFPLVPPLVLHEQQLAVMCFNPFKPFAGAAIN